MLLYCTLLACNPTWTVGKIHLRPYLWARVMVGKQSRVLDDWEKPEGTTASSLPLIWFYTSNSGFTQAILQRTPLWFYTSNSATKHSCFPDRQHKRSMSKQIWTTKVDNPWRVGKHFRIGRKHLSNTRNNLPWRK